MEAEAALPTDRYVADALDVHFEAFYRAEYRPMLHLALALVDLADRAEEIVQDSFERTLLAWARVDQPGAYLRTSVVNGCRSELRRRAVMRRRSPMLVPPSARAEDEYLWDALRSLSPKRRVALTLRFYGDFPHEEIAQLMGVRVGTVKSLVSRGLADLRKVVER
jgi:RNA polymerase sigma factor (sigma-70 family)